MKNKNTNTLITTIAINAPKEALKTLGHWQEGEFDVENKKRGKVDYVAKCYRMVSQYLEHTNFDVLVGTNEVEHFKNLGPRVKTIYKDQPIEEWKRLQGFREPLKLEMIAKGWELGYDVNYWIDSDNGVEGWDDESWERICNDPKYDVIGGTPMNVNNLSMHSGDVRDVHFKVATCLEDRLIFTNRDKLKRCIDMWSNKDKWDTLFKHNKWSTMCGSLGVMIGEAIKESGSHYMTLDYDNALDYEFSLKERVYHKVEDKKLLRWWEPLDSTRHVEQYKDRE